MKPKQLSRKTVYKNEWLHVHVDRVELVDGRIVEEQHILDFPRWSMAAIVENDRGEILFVQAYRYVLDSLEWKLPEGVIEKGETPEETAQREVEEETGVKTSDHRQIYSYNPANGMSDLMYFIVHCKALSDTGDLDESEVKEAKWLAPQQIREMITKGEIKDGLTLTSILLFLQMSEELLD